MTSTIYLDSKTNRKVIVVKPIEPEKWLVQRVDDNIQYYLNPEELIRVEN